MPRREHGQALTTLHFELPYVKYGDVVTVPSVSSDPQDDSLQKAPDDLTT